jgi:uracil phosphoribosyltransferase
MEGVTIVGHPLVQHKLTLLRDKSRSTKSFRELCRELGIRHMQRLVSFI